MVSRYDTECKIISVPYNAEPNNNYIPVSQYSNRRILHIATYIKVNYIAQNGANNLHLGIVRMITRLHATIDPKMTPHRVDVCDM